MQTSQVGIDLIKRFEGLRLEAYQDIAGVWTIGYGHTGKHAIDGNILTESFADQVLLSDLAPRVSDLNSWRITEGVELNQNEFDALVSFIFNVGFAAFKGSTAADRLRRGDRIGAAEALTWWNKATVNGVLREVQGLSRRRAAEKELFLTPRRAINVAENTARAIPKKEAKPGARMRCTTFDRTTLRKP